MGFPVDFFSMSEGYTDGIESADEFDHSANAEVVTQEIIKRYKPSPLGQIVKTVVDCTEGNSQKVIRYAKKKPYQSIAIAGLTGILIGAICTARKR
ncbi:MAG: hypothetical protein AAGA18_06035 [Verrucomicrobiota bacterium]